RSPAAPWQSTARCSASSRRPSGSACSERSSGEGERLGRGAPKGAERPGRNRRTGRSCPRPFPLTRTVGVCWRWRPLRPEGCPRGTMNISITFRQMDTSDAIKQYATDKVAKLQRFLRRPLTAHLTVSLDRRKHVVEARISSGSEHLEAHEV